jgi:hypothetical protein
MPFRDELGAALSRAEAAETSLRSHCYVHPDQPADGVCVRCDRGICLDCKREPDEGLNCPRCLSRARAAHNRRFLLVLLVATALTVAYVTFKFLGP